jgi:hypothetical protein
LETETRIKRIDALEKVLSLATKAKEELGVEVSTYELQNELRQIVHEFAGPVVLSREALEEWESRTFSKRLSNFPNFTFPPEEAKSIRIGRIIRVVLVIYFILYYPIMAVVINYVGPEHLVNIFDVNKGLVAFVLGFGIPIYLVLLIYLITAGRVKILRRALRTIRAMPESSALGKTGSVIMRPLPEAAMKE